MRAQGFKQRCHTGGVVPGCRPGAYSVVVGREQDCSPAQVSSRQSSKHVLHLSCDRVARTNASRVLNLRLEASGCQLGNQVFPDTRQVGAAIWVGPLCDHLDVPHSPLRRKRSRRRGCRQRRRRAAGKLDKGGADKEQHNSSEQR